MSLALLTYNQPAVNCLVELINLKSGQSFTTDDLTFGLPVVGDTPTDTTIDIMPAPGSQLTGGLTSMVTLPYSRLDIGQYFQGALPSLYLTPDNISVASVLAALTNQFQIYTGTGTYDGFDVTIAPDNSYATLTPNVNHLVWVGSLTAIIDQRPLLSSVLTITTLDGFDLPANLSPNCPLGQVYYGPVDGSGFINSLQVLQSGQVFSQYLPSWTLGTQLLDESWYANTTPGPYNIYGSRVLYNGPAVGPYAIMRNGAAFNGWVLIIELGSACTNRCGLLVVTYNAPVQSPSDNPLPPISAEITSNLLYN